MAYSFTNYDSSLVGRTRLMTAAKKIIPRTPYIISAFISRVPPEVLTNTIAVYISPPMPSTVSNAPKILFRFIIVVLMPCYKQNDLFNTHSIL